MKDFRARHYLRAGLCLIAMATFSAHAAPGTGSGKNKRKSIGGTIGSSVDKKKKIPAANKKATPKKSAAPRIISANRVEDAGRGLLWERCSYGQKAAPGGCGGRALRLSYFAARAHCKAQKTGNRKFRLPTLTELQSLIQAKVGGAKRIDGKLFPNNPPGTFWTDSAFRGVNRTRYVLDFHHGVSFPMGTENKALVRCVSGK